MTIYIFGGGPIGCAAAKSLALLKPNEEIILFEREEKSAFNSTKNHHHSNLRSINLVLTRRGLQIAKKLSHKLHDDLLSNSVPILGRGIHHNGDIIKTPYDNDPNNCNYSISRKLLNELWLNFAMESSNLQVKFNKRLIDFNVDGGNIIAIFENEKIEITQSDYIIGADGANSICRNVLFPKIGEKKNIKYMSSLNELSHSYCEVKIDYCHKETCILCPKDGGICDYSYKHELNDSLRNYLQIWPSTHNNKDCFLMGLSNLDDSLTGTFYMETGDLKNLMSDRDGLIDFFRKQFIDAPIILSSLESSKLSKLATVSIDGNGCDYSISENIMLIGDAAHGIVPFYGQGVNCGFEDVLYLYEYLSEFGSLKKAIEKFNQNRPGPCQGIAELAKINFIEMMVDVKNPKFLLAKKFEKFLEKRHGEYRSCYSKVMYTNTPYDDCLKLQKIQRKNIIDYYADILKSEEDFEKYEDDAIEIYRKFI